MARLTPDATPVTGQNTGAATAITATLTSVAGKTTYLQGFHVTGLGSTAGSIIAVTITGLLGGTITYYFPVPAGITVANGMYIEFPNELAASGPNVNIVVNSPSFGAGNTAQGVGAHGYNQ